MKSTRAVVIAVGLTMLATFYSLHELHKLSQRHIEQDVLLTTDRKSSNRGIGSNPVNSIDAQQSSKISVPSKPQQQVSAHNSHTCYQYENTELWGDVVVWGNNHKTDTAAQCCEACKNHKPGNADELECNVWVWCGDEKGCMGQYKQCWLKHLARPEASKPAREGANVPWTSGTLDVDIKADPAKAAVTPLQKSGGVRKFHIVTSAQGSAVHWQVRIHYYWYLKMKAQCEKEGNCEMGGFTRLLHSGHPDDLMEEIPTVVVDPLPHSMVEHSWYIVLNRPYAFVQWTQKVTIPEEYVLMSEPDHVFLRPLPNFMNGDHPAAFPFFYIEPAKPEHVKITQKFTGPITRKQLEEIAPIGNSPTYMRFDDMKKVMPIWMNVSIAIFKDQEANQVWGWVQEMYGFTIALWLGGIKKVDLFLHMMAQPPWDTQLQLSPGRPYYILHYTYGMDYKLTGEFTPGKYGEWRFDKRTYASRPIPRHLGDPPKNMKNDLVRRLIESFNEATLAIPCWDKYAETGKVTPGCTENKPSS